MSNDFIIENIKKAKYNKKENTLQKSFPQLTLSETLTGFKIKDIEEIIKDINEGQTELNKIKRMNNSFLYRIAINIRDKFRELKGEKSTHQSIYHLFDRQQQNVGRLNLALAKITKEYQKDSHELKETLDQIVDNNEIEYSQGRKIDENVPQEIKKYNSLLNNLANTERNNPNYYNNLRDAINSKRKIRNLNYKRKITNIGEKHHSQDIENLILQEEIFETVLYRIMEMTYITHLYQKTLNNNQRLWKAVHNLHSAIKSVNVGVASLTDFNEQLNQSYINSVRDISEIAKNSPARRNSNYELRRLAQNLETEPL